MCHMQYFVENSSLNLVTFQVVCYLICTNKLYSKVEANWTTCINDHDKTYRNSSMVLRYTWI